MIKMTIIPYKDLTIRQMYDLAEKLGVVVDVKDVKDEEDIQWDLWSDRLYVSGFNEIGERVVYPRGVWFNWGGGSNPVPGEKVKVKTINKNYYDVFQSSEDFYWGREFYHHFYDIVEFMVM